MTRLSYARAVGIALTLMAQLAPSSVHAQSPLMVARGSVRGWLLTWTPFGSGATSGHGSVHLVAEGEEWRGTFFNDQATFYGVSADERALRFNAETFWVDANVASDMLDQFGGATGDYVQQSAEFLRDPRRSIFDTRYGSGGNNRAGESWHDETGNGTNVQESGSGARDNDGPWIGRDETPELVTDEPSVGPLMRDASTMLTSTSELSGDVGAPAAALETTVPEPSTYLLVGSGLLLMMARRRRSIGRADRRGV